MFAASEMVGSVALLREIFAPYPDVSPGVISLEAPETLFSHPRHEEAFVAKYLLCLTPGKEEALSDSELDNIFWLPGPENAEGGPAKVKGDMAAL